MKKILVNQGDITSAPIQYSVNLENYPQMESERERKMISLLDFMLLLLTRALNEGATTV